MYRQTYRLIAPISSISSSNSRAMTSAPVPHYDLIVIGGGSGGLACSKEAADMGKKVAVLDFVSPSPRGTSWGLGGTCVNVGCIPKKLMHHVSMMGDTLRNAGKCGWQISGEVGFSWEGMCQKVQNYVRSLNWGHRVALREKNVTYLNAKGSFVDSKTIKAVDKNGKDSTLTGDKIVIAVGGRPRYPNIPGAKEYGISSDDIFWMQKPPGKTLVIGGSYVALECAGFLHGMLFDTTVMVRSICLRGFDQQMAGLVAADMEKSGMRFLWQCIPHSVEKQADGKLKVTWEHTSGDGKGRRSHDTFDTVLFAIGRDPDTASLNLGAASVQMNESSGKVVGGFGQDNERSSVDNIYAIGDILEKGIELTPVAIRAGRLLARRVFGDSTIQMDYNLIATTVFTPLEYACVGYSEEAAEEKFGGDNLLTYHAFYKPLEFNLTERDSSQCYIKAICNVNNGEQVIGFHISGPNAGEIMQGFAAAIRLGMTKYDLGNTVGIHPTSAEEVVKLNVSKQSGGDATVTGC